MSSPPFAIQGEYARAAVGCVRMALLAMSLVGGPTACSSPKQSLTLATTTSVANSGLLDAILPAYERDTRMTVRSHLVGSGRALALLAADQADVAITHAPAAEEAALRSRPTWRYTKIMFNDFVIAGPSSDPASVRGSRDAVDAMRKIATAGGRFISRGDGSGTHERELALWKQGGGAPPGTLLVAAGAGMGATLRIASEMEAYTLTDRATFMQQKLPLVILFENDPLLINTYAVTFDTARASAREAERFASWLADGPGRTLIGAFRVGAEGVVAFTPWPIGRSRSRPSDLP
jgi:tungstate transport system substrate-binding protein